MDTSALVKIYADEQGRDEVQRALEEVRVTAISSVGLGEARSALLPGRNAKGLSQYKSTIMRSRFCCVTSGKSTLCEWSQRIINRAGAITRTHALRALDAVHLATALSLRDEAYELAVARQTEPREVPLWESDEFQVRLLAYDHSLIEAARQEGFA